MSRKQLIYLIFITLVAVIVIFVIAIVNKISNMPMSSRDVDLSSIEAQMEYINILPNTTKFLTYKSTAVAEIKDTKDAVDILTEQNILGEINELFWYPDGDKIFISFMNDPEVLGIYSGYKDTKTEFVYSVYTVGEKEPKFIQNTPDKAWLTGNTIFGITNNKLKRYENGKWINTNISISNLLISSAGNSFGDYKDGITIIYDERLREIRKLSHAFAEPLRIRIFDGGDIVYAESKSISIFKKGGKYKKELITEDDQFAAGGNVFIYTKDKQEYLYNSTDSKIYKINFNIKDIDYYKLFGLNQNGAIYFNGDDYVATVIRFK